MYSRLTISVILLDLIIIVIIFYDIAALFLLRGLHYRVVEIIIQRIFFLAKLPIEYAKPKSAYVISIWRLAILFSATMFLSTLKLGISLLMNDTWNAFSLFTLSKNVN